MNKFGALFVGLVAASGCLGPVRRSPSSAPAVAPAVSAPAGGAGLIRLSADRTPEFLDDLDREDLDMAPFDARGGM
ncbi:MAG TPA: hypothetical protein PLT11_08105, partial [Elusimicrobiota bacterium]|nr:hypothetical protein [Elusimicrobiota bacterium]